jgi:hypothetical protein
MSEFRLSFKYRKNRNVALSPGELKNLVFFGIPVITPDGSLLSDQEIDTYIRSAVAEIEAELDIKIPLQTISETKSFLWDNYRNWAYIKTSYPVVCVDKIDGFVGTVRQVQYPKGWFSIQESSDGIRHRTVRIVPNSGSGGVVDNSVVYAGIYPQLGYYGNRNIPDYWKVTYTTGWKIIPDDLFKIIVYKAAIPIFDLLGDIVIGAGIASQSLGLDGLSQSVSTTSSAENSAYSSRIKSYQSQIKELMSGLKKKYAGVIWGSV